MTTEVTEVVDVETLERAVTKLSPDDLARFRTWFERFAADTWDRQIEADIKAGRLDRLADEALAEHRAGLSRKL